MPYPVKHFHYPSMGGVSSMGSGYGTNTAQRGKLIQVIKACLFDGFNVTPVVGSNMTYDAGTGSVTIEFGVAHGFIQHQIIAITGADQVEYNGEHRVSVIGETYIEFKPASTPSASPATTSDTIEVKTAPIGGWEIIAEDENSHNIAIRSTDPDATPYVWFIENDFDRDNTYRQSIAYVRMVDNFVDFETYEQLTYFCWPSSHYASVEEWTLIGDSKMIYFIPRFAYYDRRSVYILGDFNTIRPGDNGHCIGIGHNPSTTAHQWHSSGGQDAYTEFATLTSTRYRSIATSYTQLPGVVPWLMRGIDAYMGNTFTFPSLPTNGFYVSTQPIMLEESGKGLRGFMPGLVQPLQTSDLYDNVILTNVPGFEGIPILFQVCAYSYRADYAGKLCGWRLDDWREVPG